MGFAYARQYQVDVVIAERLPWDAAVWQALAPGFDPLLAGAYGTTALQTAQHDSGKRLRPGKLAWDERSHERWTLRAGSSRTFVSTEAWAPSWKHCARERRPPNIYLHVVDRSTVTGSLEPAVILAVALDVDPAALAAADKAMRIAADVLRAKAHGRSLRRWARSNGAEFTDAIQDVGLSSNLTRVSSSGALTLRRTWEPVR